ncbi:MAG TPA: hypothetical protein VNN10_11235 [Dehalococcoidia bacterium]|nr:hypothetical protein [Dehalococcoidia bacterium]
MASAPRLTGTLPVRTFDPERFVGTVVSDGQTSRVSCIAANHNGIGLLGLVGFDTSVSAALAKLNLKEQLFFTPAEGLEWRTTRWISRRSGTSYRQVGTALSIKNGGERPTSLREKHYLYMPSCLDIADGILNPPDLPPDPKPEGETRPGAIGISHQPITNRFLVGNAGEELPAQSAFVGTLMALRVPFLRARDDGSVNAALLADRKEQEVAWAAELWSRGLAAKLIAPLPSLGIRAWEIDGDRRKWMPLITQGISEKWLPWSPNPDFVTVPAPAPSLLVTPDAPVLTLEDDRPAAGEIRAMAADALALATAIAA